MGAVGWRNALPEVRGNGMNKRDPFEVLGEISLTGEAKVSGYEVWLFSQGPGAPKGSLPDEHNHSEQLDQQQRNVAQRKGETK